MKDNMVLEGSKPEVLLMHAEHSKLGIGYTLDAPQYLLSTVGDLAQW